MDDAHGSPTSLQQAAEELEMAVAELRRTRVAHCKVESLLLAVLDHVPLGMVVVDAELRVRAASSYAQERWAVVLDKPLDDGRVPPPVRTAIDATMRTGQRSLIIGAGAGEVAEPGDGVRYVVGWGSIVNE